MGSRRLLGRRTLSQAAGRSSSPLSSSGSESRNRADCPHLRRRFRRLGSTGRAHRSSASTPTTPNNACIGNITAITDNLSSANNQTFGYDERDRLTSWTLGGTTQNYSYNPIGNLTSKAGLTYSYADPAHKHAVTSDGIRSYGYDANGNQTTINGVTRYTWNAENLPSSITGGDGVTESYGYDGDGERVRKTRNGITTIYLEGLWEEVTGGAEKALYPFNGAVVATRDGNSASIYLHGDHLGSISLTTGNGGALLSQQEFDPWARCAPLRSEKPRSTLPGNDWTGQGCCIIMPAVVF